MKRVLVIANNLQQASYRLRIAALVPLMRERGFEWDVQVRPQSVLARRRLMNSAGGYDSVILQRKLLGGLDARVLRKRARRIFYDIDDAVMVDEHPRGVISKLRNGLRYRATYTIIDHVVAGNQELAAMFRQGSKTVTVIPTVVDPHHYQVKQHSQTDAPTLVWIGSHSTVPYVQQFMPDLERAAERVKGLRLIVIADAAPQSSKLPVELVPWSVETEAASLLRGDIGIAPTPDTIWTRGKSGFKIVQYMAAGLPIIASSVGANADLVTKGVTGLLPGDGAGWAEAICKLAQDPALRESMGCAGRVLVERQLNLTRAADDWATILS